MCPFATLYHSLREKSVIYKQTDGHDKTIGAFCFDYGIQMWLVVDCEISLNTHTMYPR